MESSKHYPSFIDRLNKNFKLILLLLLFSSVTLAQKDFVVKSPNGQITYHYSIINSQPSYTISFNGKKVIDDSDLTMNFKENGSLKDLSVSHYTRKKINEKYELIVGKSKNIENKCNELRLNLKERSKTGRKLVFVIRVYDDGVAFRYEFPEQENWRSFVMTDELTSFNISKNPTVYALWWGNYNNDHEGLYNITPFNEIKQDTLLDMPSLFNFSDEIYMAITEANLRDYAGMYLKKKEGKLVSQLSPLPGQKEIKVKATLPHKSPWRVILLSDRIGDLIESNIITSVSDPLEIDDTSWIKPGKTDFHWWNGDITPDTTFAPGANFATNKYYIDFCAKNNIDYHAVIGYGGFAWYKSDADGYSSVGPNTDVTTPVGTLDMQKVCDYAKSKGVDIDVWVNWKALYPQLENAFTQYEEWGVKGLMVDFINRDDQEMVNIMEEILKSAASHKLYIQFHGSFKPVGLHRTYPNEFTREGTHNYEQNKWRSKPISPEHDLNVVYTRMLAGPTDYHLGGFRAVKPDDFTPQYTRPLMGGTRSHMMAMYVVLESYLSMVADFPKAYENQEGFEFIKNVPTSWDNTHFCQGKLQEYAIIARKKADIWYVGGINNSVEREIDFSFDFLDNNRSYKVTLYQDAANAKTAPNELQKINITVKKGDHKTIKMAAGGGVAMRIMPAQ
jgi:alpha-glucosidase